MATPQNLARPADPTQAMRYYLGDMEGLSPSSGRGEWDVLYAAIRSGIPVRNARMMRKRIPIRVFDRVLPRTTLASKKPDARLNEQQSERVIRVARVYTLAAEAFGNRERGHGWMERANPVLEGAAPADLLDNEAGARRVEELLGQLEHGIAA